MRLKPQIRLKTVAMSALLFCHKPDEVLTFCQACKNYGKNYSCPQFDFETTTWLADYDYATLILTITPTAELANRRAELAAGDYRSATYQQYSKGDDDDLFMRISMYAFEQIKYKLNDKLLKYERRAAGVISIPPGSCSYCKSCAKARGERCLYPEKLRYSLEALGFLVSAVLDVFFDYEIDWRARDFGTDFVTISALFSRVPINEDDLLRALDDLALEL